ncbi:DUF2726 domain-containing protein [Altererythrobacter aurantiacus]|uniref:DUF2726 domain-containing protein n=2 Tax=Parapontixanthobacter aurantiacus TaxID=1463599 RepID=A0A844ZEG1_9SPHN|nr:DUF2726 domain-containing protein [Parapontixanthobacter aurantiacus]
MGQWLSIILFFAVVALVVGVLKAFLSPKKKPRRRSNYRQPYLKDVSDFRGKGSTADAAEQLRIVMEANFQSRSLLNRPEAKVFKALDEAVIARNPGWQVMAQVSLGEFLSSKSKPAYFAVNSKRVDFALMDEKCCVVHALEYQGSGHHQGSAAARDAVKKEALRKAGIGYHEIVAGHTTPSELRALVEKLVPAG